MDNGHEMYPHLQNDPGAKTFSGIITLVGATKPTED